MRISHLFAFVCAIAALLVVTPPARAASIYFCTTNDGVHSGAIYQAWAGDENYQFVAAVAGCGGTNAAGSLALSSQGDLFDAVGATGTIYEINPGGNVSTFASGLPVNDTPINLAFDQNGNLFVTSPANSTIYEYTPGGLQSVFYNGPSAVVPGYGDFLAPGPLAVDGTGDVFVGVANWCVDEIAPGGAISNYSCLGEQLGSGISSLLLNGDDLFAGFGNGGGSDGVWEIAPNGTATQYFANNGTSSTGFDGSGNLFFGTGLTIEEIPAGGGAPVDWSTRIFADVGDIAVDDLPSSTPEPSGFLLMAAGAGIIAGCARRLRPRGASHSAL